MIQYTEYDSSGNVIYADPPIEERAKRQPICPKCVGSVNKRYCYFKRNEKVYPGATACSDFESIPKNLKEWIKYHFNHQIKNRYHGYKYLIQKNLGWLKYSYIDCGRLPSLLKAGDTIEYEYDDNWLKELNKSKDTMNKTFDVDFKYEGIHTMKINKLWIEYGNNGKSESGIEDKFYIMANTSEGISTLNALLEHKNVISINKNKSYKDPGIYSF